MLNFAIPLTGMHDAQWRMQAVAHNVAVANVGPPTLLNRVVSSARPNGTGVNTFVHTEESALGTDLATEAVNMHLAKHAFAANAKTLKSQWDTSGTLLDILDNRQRE
jgi:flagellar basal body rod protein FlgC